MDRVAAVCGVLGSIDRFKRLWATAKGLPLNEFIVVAQKIDDASAKWIKRQGIHLIRKDESLAFSVFNNLAVKEAKECDWLLLLNDDLELQPTFWDGFEMAQTAEYDVFGAKLLYPNGTIQHCGKLYTMDMFPFHVLRGQPGDHPDANKMRKYPGVTFACVGIAKAVWDSIGGLDEEFTNGYEDDAFCLAAAELGADIGIHPAMSAIHHESQTTGQDNANKEAMWEKFREKWIFSNRITYPLGVIREWRFG